VLKEISFIIYPQLASDLGNDIAERGWIAQINGVVTLLILE
jgi:hypothetical protein